MCIDPEGDQFNIFIGILVTPYRVWARAAATQVSKWMSTLDREWIANGPKKASADAVYDIALDAEAAMGSYGHVNVVMMDDLE